MLSVNHKNIEIFFDYLDEVTEIIYKNSKKDYLDSLLLAIDYILNDESLTNMLATDILKEVKSNYELINNITFNKEEIRKALQLSLLKAFKHLNISFNEITPDTIGILFSYFIDILFKDKNNISVLDANVGCGNLLFSMLNNTKVQCEKLFGIDYNYKYLNISLHIANLLEYEVEFFNQNNLSKLLVPPVDLIISDLPVGFEDNIESLDLQTAKNNISYKPYLMIENLMKYGKEGSYFIYLIPNEFFNESHNELIKEIILSETHIQAIIQLPLDMFKDERYQKSIIILQKRGKNIKVNKEILMLSFPSFSNKNKVTKAIDKINQWFKKNKQ